MYGGMVYWVLVACWVVGCWHVWCCCERSFRTIGCAKGVQSKKGTMVVNLDRCISSNIAVIHVQVDVQRPFYCGMEQDRRVSRSHPSITKENVAVIPSSD